MNIMSSGKWIRLGVSLLIAGMCFLLLENIFYQTLDENNVLQESLFMPLGAIAIVLGALVVAIAMIVKWVKK